MPGSLDTTNTMLAIIAGVALLQAIVIIGLGFAGWKIYRLATETIREIDERRVKPLAAKVDGLLDRAHQVTDRVHEMTDRVTHTATAAKTSVNDTVHKVSGAVGGIRAAIVNALTTEGNGHRHPPAVYPPAPAPGVAHPDNEEARRVREGGF